MLKSCGAVVLAVVAADGPTREQKGSHAVIDSAQQEGLRAPGPGPNGLARTPPMGWMSWQVFRCQTDCAKHPDSCIDENLYKTMADRISEDGYLDLGYDQVSIDDCWENHDGRNSQGRLFPDASRFPSGMKALGDYMHGKGVRFGTYSDEGTKTCGGFPGTKGYEDVDAKTFASWGVDYLKLDGCYNNAAGYVTGYPAAGAALQASGRNISYSCSWPAYLGSDESAKPFSDMIDAGCNLWRNWDDIQCNWGSLSSIIDHWGDYGETLVKWAGPGHWHDMDMLLIGAGCLTPEEERTQMAIWAISASPLIMGNDLRKVSSASKAILQNKGAIAVSQDKAGKMGRRHSSFTSDSPTQVWSRQLENGEVAVGLYNKKGAAPAPIPPPPCAAWNKTEGGYLEACGGAAGNLGTFSGLSAEEAQDACCKNLECAGFDFNKVDGSGYYKRSQDCGMVRNDAYDGYTKPSQMPGTTKADITVKFGDLGLSGKVSVHDIWAGKDLGVFQGSFTAKNVAVHDTVFLRLSAASSAVVV